MMGHSTIMEEASLELQRRLEDTTDTNEVTKVKSALDLLLKREGVAAPSQMADGVYTFVWAKIGKFMQGVRDGTIRISGAAVLITGCAS